MHAPVLRKTKVKVVLGTVIQNIAPKRPFIVHENYRISQNKQASKTKFKKLKKR